MKPSELDRIRARLAAITHGEWLPVLGSGIHQCTAVASDVSGEMHPTFICDCLPDYVLKMDGFALPKDHVPNLIFIEHAPTDIAKLLRIIDSLIERGMVAPGAAVLQ